MQSQLYIVLILQPIFFVPVGGVTVMPL